MVIFIQQWKDWEYGENGEWKVNKESVERWKCDRWEKVRKYWKNQKIKNKQTSELLSTGKWTFQITSDNWTCLPTVK